MKVKSVNEAYADEETRQWLTSNFEIHQEEGWQVWQEPWFRREHPMHYAILKLLAKIGL
jgi:hypothetical protein